MANAYKLYKVCSSCKGTGKLAPMVEHGEEPDCSDCQGTGIVLSGYCTEATYNIPEIPE